LCTAANASDTGWGPGEFESLATKAKLYEFTNRWLGDDAPDDGFKVFERFFHDEMAQNEHNINYKAVAVAALCHHVSILKKRSPTEREINLYWGLTTKARGALRKKVSYARGKNPV
jgi:hypothetical protein